VSEFNRFNLLTLNLEQMISTDGTTSNTANSIHHAGDVNSQKVAEKVTEVIMLNPEWKKKHHKFHG